MKNRAGPRWLLLALLLGACAEPVSDNPLIGPDVQANEAYDRLSGRYIQGDSCGGGDEVAWTLHPGILETDELQCLITEQTLEGTTIRLRAECVIEDQTTVQSFALTPLNGGMMLLQGPTADVMLHPCI